MNSEKVYSLAVLGGGIAGAGIARDAALRGLSVIVFEKNTFGSGTSSKSSKLIHGGLRYLETSWKCLKRGNLAGFFKNLRFVISSLRETRILRKIAGDLIKPIPLLIPIYKKDGQSRTAVYFGTLFYGFLSKLIGAGHFPRILRSREAVLKVAPSLKTEGLLSAVMIWDHTTDDKKLVEATMLSAQGHGAVAMEQARVAHYQFDKKNKAYEIKTDIRGIEKTFYARKIIDARGPWVPQELIIPVAGSHLNFAQFTEVSVILTAEDGRLFFVISKDGISRVGTTERIDTKPDTVVPSEEEINYLLSELNNFFPAAGFSHEDILSMDAGIRPLAKPLFSQDPHDISREHKFVTTRDGVIHVLGVKLTDHRRAAKALLDKLTKIKCRTHQTRL